MRQTRKIARGGLDHLFHLVLFTADIKSVLLKTRARKAHGGHLIGRQTLICKRHGFLNAITREPSEGDLRDRIRSRASRFLPVMSRSDLYQGQPCALLEFSDHGAFSTLLNLQGDTKVFSH